MHNTNSVSVYHKSGGIERPQCLEKMLVPEENPEECHKSRKLRQT